MKSQCRIALEQPGSAFGPKNQELWYHVVETHPLQKNNLWNSGISIKIYAKGLRPITGKTRQPMPSQLCVLHHFAFSRHMLDFMR